MPRQLMLCPKNIFRFIRHVHVHLKTDKVDFKKEDPDFSLHFFAIPSSSRHEKCWQMTERIFCLFQYSRNIGCIGLATGPQESRKIRGCHYGHTLLLLVKGQLICQNLGVPGTPAPPRTTGLSKQQSEIKVHKLYNCKLYFSPTDNVTLNIDGVLYLRQVILSLIVLLSFQSLILTVILISGYVIHTKQVTVRDFLSKLFYKI